MGFSRSCNYFDKLFVVKMENILPVGHTLIYDCETGDAYVYSGRLGRPLAVNTVGGYLSTDLPKSDMCDKQRTNVLIHRLIAMTYIPNPLGLPCVDHVDGDRKNNLLSNLQWVTKQQNSHNIRSAKGYHWDKRCQKFMAKIKVDGKTKYLGLFETEADAHAAYCAARLLRNTASGATTVNY